MSRKTMHSVVALAAIIVLSACATSRADDAELYADRAVNLGWVAGAVQGLVEFGNPGEDLKGAELVREATKDNPKLMEPLADFYVIGRRVGEFSSVLMCDAARTRALAEDAGCTSAKLDAPLWDIFPQVPCAFQLDVAAVCTRK